MILMMIEENITYDLKWKCDKEIILIISLISTINVFFNNWVWINLFYSYFQNFISLN